MLTYIIYFSVFLILAFVLSIAVKAITRGVEAKQIIKEEKNLEYFIYKPTLELVNYVKSLNVPVVCFPREIKDYKKFVDVVKPDVVNIDYSVDPKSILKDIKIPIQGGLDPKILLTQKENIKKKVEEYLNIFKDHPYIFNLGHGILPDTNPEVVNFLVKTVRDFK